MHPYPTTGHAGCAAGPLTRRLLNRGVGLDGAHQPDRSPRRPTRKERHPCLTSEWATLATEEARSLTSPRPQVPARRWPPPSAGRRGAWPWNRRGPSLAIQGGYRVTLVARSRDGLGNLAGTLADTGAKINTLAADASDPDRLGAPMRELYLGTGAPGVIVYNAVMGAPDQLLSSSVAHLQGGVFSRCHQRHRRRAGGRPGHASRRLRDHPRHGGRVRRPPDPGPCDRFPRQGGSPVGRDYARR